MSEPTYTPARRHPVREFFMHLVEMPRSHKIVLTLAAALTIAGLAGQVPGLVRREPAPAVSNSTPPPGASSAFGSSAHAPAADTTRKPTMTERVSPWATRVGIGLIGGFIIGWAFRAFLKVMATITFVVAALFLGLSYFNVLNIDFSAAEKQFKDSSEWVSDQASRAKDSAMSHLPGSMSSFIGMFLGFRRK